MVKTIPGRRQLALSSAIPRGKHTQPCKVYGLVLQVRAYCAQYNIRKTTTNSSTIGALLIVLLVNGTWKRELFSMTVEKRLKIGSWRVVRSLIQLLMVVEIVLLTLAASRGHRPISFIRIKHRTRADDISYKIKY